MRGAAAFAMNHRVVTLLASFVVTVSALVAVGAGCAAPADEDVGDGAGASTGAAWISKLQPGAYFGGATECFIYKGGKLGDELSASIKWGPGLYDFGELDVSIGDRALGRNDDTGMNDGGVKCPFTVRATDATHVRVKSSCGRGDATLTLDPDNDGVKVTPAPSASVPPPAPSAAPSVGSSSSGSGGL
jgi:hypothetical protein